MSAVAEKLVTIKEFAQEFPETEMRRELVRGRIVELMPTGGIHSIIALTIGRLLQIWAKKFGGYVGVEAGFNLFKNPDTTRVPDVFYVRAERIPTEGVPEGFWNLAPDLAVEVISPSETAQGVRDKVSDFLAAGTPLVWLVYPRTREVVAHTADGLARTYGVNDVLEFDLLPGFSCTVAELFEV